MKTLTVTAARQKLRSWLRESLQGKDIGIMIDGAIVALRPVQIYSEDYAKLKYDATVGDLDKFVKRTNDELDTDRKARRLRRFTGRLKRD